ncbi:RTC4-like domain-containing protein [Aspergillus varians]
MPTLRTRQSLPHPTTPKPTKAKSEDEEDVNAPPRGTSDEESPSEDEQSDGLESTPRNRRTWQTEQTRKTLEEKLAENNDNNNKKKKTKNLKSPGSSRKRKSEAMLSSSPETRDQQMMWNAWSQQGHKRRSYSYGSKFRKTPTSSMAESHPPSSVPQAKSSLTSFSQQADSPDEDKEEEENEESGENGFKVPRDFDSRPPALSQDHEVPDSDDDSPLSSAISCNSSSDILMKGGDDSEDVEPAEYLCPMCKAPVEPGLLITFQAQPRQRIRDQYIFCESHKKSSVEKMWKDRGYPTIDWEKFNERIESHFNELEKLMVPDNSSSYYRNVLDTTLKSGKAKNFRLTLSGDDLEKISCGYYGTRGSERMLQAITARFARRLRRLATEDHIVKQAGVVAYSQAVLVPELAVRLIKEDMNVDDDSARQIMRESIDIGEKLNPTPNDAVPATEETDEAGSPNH